MLEIEIKAYCDDLKNAAESIISLGGSMLEVRNETDIYFNHPARDFSETDEALRIRSAGGKNILTYKGPKLGTKSKTRFEQEIEINDPDFMKVILQKLGFVPAGEVRKERTVYVINNVEICLDRVHGVGSFVELEIKDTDKEKGEKILFDLAEKMGLTRFERRSYLELKLKNRR